jgi:hypothetical protein
LRLSKYHYGDQLKEEEMGGACSMNGAEEKYILVYDEET